MQWPWGGLSRAPLETESSGASLGFKSMLEPGSPRRAWGGLAGRASLLSFHREVPPFPVWPPAPCLCSPAAERSLAHQHSRHPAHAPTQGPPHGGDTLAAGVRPRAELAHLTCMSMAKESPGFGWGNE